MNRSEVTGASDDRPTQESAAKTPRRAIALEAKPGVLSIEAATTAVVVVDMQNDFGTNGGMFDRAGNDITMIQRAVGPTAKVLASARRAGVKVVYLKMGFRPDLSDLGASDSVNRVRHLEVFKVGQTIRAPDGRESRILIRDNWGTDIVPELKPQPDDVVVYKHRFSGFYETELDATLKRLEVKHPIFTGYHECMRGFDHPRCDVRRLSACAARGLHWRATRIPFSEKQLRCFALGHRDVIGLGFWLGRVCRSPRGRVVSEPLKVSCDPLPHPSVGLWSGDHPRGQHHRCPDNAA